MKPTHGFKNPLIGFGERLEEGTRGGAVGDLKRWWNSHAINHSKLLLCWVTSRRGWSISSPPQLVMDTRPTAAGTSNWLSHNGRDAAVHHPQKISTACQKKREKKKINNVQYCCLSYFSLLLGGKWSVSSLLCVLWNAIHIHQVCQQPIKGWNQHQTKIKCCLIYFFGKWFRL